MSEGVCAHCGLPAPPVEDGDSFCCVGCEAVFYALSEAGLEHFYDLRGQQGEPPPPDSAGDAGQFLDQIRTNQDGTVELDVYLDGVHCAGCVWLVERMPQALPGVVDARLNLSRARLNIRWNPDDVTLGDTTRWLGRFGYVAHPVDLKRGEGASTAERRILFKAGVSWALAMNVMIIAVALYSGLDTSLETGLASAARWTSMVLTGISIMFGGREFLARAWGSFFPWAGWAKLSVDVPISLGILVGFGFSAHATVVGRGEIWFDSIVVLIAALLSARWLQMRGRRHASNAAERLLQLLPARARKWVSGAFVEVDADTLALNDRIEVRLGDVFPADGVVIQGSSHINRALLTGESRPEAVVSGDQVHAGETNLTSSLEIRVSASGEDTRVGKLLAWVEEAAQNRAPVVQLADRLSGWFVVVVLLAALGTVAVWWNSDPDLALQHAVALLVVSCPCALGMATPLALTVGLGKAARHGVFIKHDDVIEAIRSVDVIVFDKTGTVTKGQTQLVEIGVPSEWLGSIAALERSSQHPVARAFEDWDDASIQPEAVVETLGAGVEGVVNGHRLQVGRPDWVEPGTSVETLIQRGLSPIALSVDGVWVGNIGLGDVSRPEAKSVIQQMQNRQIRPVLLSGDHEGIVSAMGRELGLRAEDCFGGQTPEDKLKFVQDLQQEGLVVAMVGDGVNDAAAMQAADVGVAVQGGTDLNLVAADVILTRPGIQRVADLFDGADHIMSVVRRNLAGSVGYNIIGITAAAFGLVTPLVAAVAMPVSSLSVVLSSLWQTPFGRARVTEVDNRAPVQENAAAE